MDTTFVAALEKRARIMLPPGTVMLIECAGDRTGDPGLIALLAEVQGKGLRNEPLCPLPCETVTFPDRVLLVCGGCPRMETLPRVAGIGRGGDPEEAERNALYALTLPLDRPNARRAGFAAAQTWGEGPAEAVRTACILNRVAYRSMDEAYR